MTILLDVGCRALACCAHSQWEVTLGSPQSQYKVYKLPDDWQLTITSLMQVLSLMEYLAFCREHHLPVNDVWLFARTKAAAGAAAALDDAANAALPTAAALEALDGVAADFPQDSIRVRGTYPHMQWQGSRIEGFVVAQGCQVYTAHSNPVCTAHNNPSPCLRLRGCHILAAVRKMLWRGIWMCIRLRSSAPALHAYKFLV